MARKRMLSPELWENEGFGALDLLGKLLYIGMISQADDEGRGILSSQLLKSKILPYDIVRNADVDKALSDIGHKTSTIFYEFEGKHYYCFENWKKWQYIQKPIPSKFPGPPGCGEGESLSPESELPYKYDSSTVVVPYEYGTKGKEKKGNEMNRIEGRMRAREEFIKRYGIIQDVRPPENLDYSLLTEKVEASAFLKEKRGLSFFVKFYDRIIKDEFKDFPRSTQKSTSDNYEQRRYTKEEIDEMQKYDDGGAL